MMGNETFLKNTLCLAVMCPQYAGVLDPLASSAPSYSWSNCSSNRITSYNYSLQRQAPEFGRSVLGGQSEIKSGPGL